MAHLALCDLLSSTTIGEFERDNFVNGWSNASSPSAPLDSTARQAAHINILRKQLVGDPAYFKQVYRSAFKLAKSESQRSVPMESAIDFWRMFFSSSTGGVEWNTRQTLWLDLWCEFYESQSKRPVNKDLWNMVGELMMKTREDGGETLSWWSEDGAWPMAVDEFVAWIKERRKANGEVVSGDEMDTS